MPLPEPAPSAKPPAQFFAKALFLILLVSAVYVPSTQNQFIWDDDHHAGRAVKFHQDGLVRGLQTIWFEPLAAAQYYPMVWSSFLLEHHFWGQDPLGYHVVNILLHIGVALLLWRVLCQLGLPWPFAASLLFALHPVHVESVAWVSERKNVLSGFFYMASLLAFLKWHLPSADHSSTKAGAPQKGRNHLYFLSALLFACALTSKTVTASLPFVIMLVLWWKQQLNRAVVVRLMPFVVAGVAMGSVTIWMEQGHAGAIGEPWDLSFLERCLIAGRAIWFYVGKLLVPFKLTFIYPRWHIDSSDLVQYLFPLSALGLLVALWLLSRRRRRGPLAAVLIYGGTLFPALGFINVFPMQFSFVADHFQYLASIAIITLFVSLAHRFMGAFPTRFATAVCFLVLSLYCTQVWQLQAQYKDQTTLWIATIAKNPSAWIAHGNLGAIYMNEGRDAEAMESLARSLALNPKQIIAHNNLAKLHLRKARELRDGRGEAVATRIQQHVDQALLHGNRAVVLGQDERAYLSRRLLQPPVAQDHVESEQIVGDIKRFQGDSAGAMGHYRVMLTLNPRSSDAFSRIGALELESGDYGRALGFFHKALAANPGRSDVLYNMGIAYYRINKLAQAEDALQLALRNGAAEEFVLPHYYLGLIDQAMERSQEAREHFEIVALKMPEHRIAHKALQRMLDLAFSR